MSLLVDRENFESDESRQEFESCLKQLLQSSWCGLLSALSLLLDASTDDTTTETILKHLVQKLSSLFWGFKWIQAFLSSY
jgi:hypothetical protein